MATSERPAVVVDVMTKWTVDAVLFFATAVAFLLWGVIGRNASANILSWAIMSTVALLMNRMWPLLADSAVLAAAHGAPPADAVRQTWQSYALAAAGMMAVLCAVYAVLVAYVAPPGFLAGWMTAYTVSRLRGLAAAREIERATAVRLSMRFQFGWRRRPPLYYATPRLGA